MPRQPLLPGQRPPDYGRYRAEKQRAMHEASLRESKDFKSSMTMLHDNSVDGSRDWGSGMLFTPAEPLQIRPMDDMGVGVRCHDDGSIDLRVDHAKVQKAKDALDMQQLLTSHDLCVACEDTFSYYCRYRAEQKKQGKTSTDGEKISPMNNNVVHHATLWSLLAFAKVTRTCLICTEIWNKIQSTYPNLDPKKHDSEPLTEYRIECCWPIRSETLDEHKMWFVMVNPSVDKDPLWNWQPLLRVSLWPQSQFGHYFDKWESTADFVPIRGPWDWCSDDGTTDNLDTRGLALGWLERCKQNTGGQHGLCSQQDTKALPTRLLDVQKALEKRKVYLVVPEEQPHMFEDKASREYVTLSHCWGKWGAINNPVLLAGNLFSRKNGGLSWGKLPRTFQDAFRIASWFGWNWLWIDSLCIIQDSQSDWRNEASMMDEIYQNAQLNISPDVGNDSRSGCFSKRSKDDITPLQLSSKEAESTWTVTTQNAFDWMRSATSFSRAWIHRERQLSRRIFHFTEKEVVWECCGLGKSGFASETLPGGAPFDRLFNGETKFQAEWSDFHDTSRIGSEDRLGNVHRLWNSTCEDLSKKSVTYPTDLPVILSSLAREMHRMIPDDEYLCGLWRSTLPESLAWKSNANRPSDIGFIAPSWSWLNSVIPVELAVNNRHQNKLPVAEILKVDVGLVSDDPYGGVTKGELHVSGYLRRLHFHFIDPSRFILSVIEKDDNGEDRLRLIGPDWNQYDGQVCQLTHDAALVLDFQEHECYALFTTIAEQGQDILTCSRKITCLLLDPVEGKENTFKRIGTLQNLCDEYSFKMRYCVSSGVNCSEAGIPRSLHVENAIGYQGPPSSTISRCIGSPASSSTQLWDLLAEFIRRNRSIAISWSKDHQRDITTKAGRSSNAGPETEAGLREIETTENPDETEAYDLLNDMRCIPYKTLVRLIRQHPSSGTPVSTSEQGESALIEQGAQIISQTEAYGNNKLPPSDTLYQFDDVLDILMDEQGIVPWLERLGTTEITLV